jgi:hypothetical protein
LEITAELPSGAINIKENSMSQLDLLKLNVNDHVEKKQNLSYLSWAWAWAEALKADPAANFEVMNFSGKPYTDINGTAMVWVTVTMFGKPMTCFLPVMNSSNQPISIEGRKFKDKYGNEKVEKIDSFNVNTAIMRCMTKGLALHGLGLYIYAGEDLPQTDEIAPVIVKAVTPDGTAMADVQVNTGQADVNAELFAEGMMTYTNHCTDVKGLNSYWKANQGQLDGLKVSHPDLYGQVRNRFAELKKQLSEKT